MLYLVYLLDKCKVKNLIFFYLNSYFFEFYIHYPHTSLILFRKFRKFHSYFIMKTPRQARLIPLEILKKRKLSGTKEYSNIE